MSALIVFGLAIIPGLPWAVAWARAQHLDLLDTFVLASALGLGLGSLVASALLVAGSLDPFPIIAIALLVTGVGMVVLAATEVRRGLRAAQGPEGPDRGRRITPRRAITLGLMAVALLPPIVSQAVTALPDGLPRASTSWYYALLSLESASAGSLPATLLEWGIERSFKADYLTFTAHLASAESLDPAGLGTLETYRLLVLILAMLALVAFFRRWSPAAAVLTVGIFLSGNLWITKFDSLRPEAYGVATMAMGLFALGHAWDAAGRWRIAWALLAGILGIVTALGHLEIALVGGVIALAAIVAGGERRLGERFRIAIASGILAMVGFVGALLLTGSGLPGAGELGARRGAVDSTWEFFGALVEGGSRPMPVLPTDPAFLAASARFPWPALDILAAPGLLLAGLVSLAVVAVLVGPADPRARRLVLFGALVVGLLVIVSVVVFVVFPTYVPRRIGFRRLVPYAALGVSAIIAAGAVTAPRALALVARRPRAPAPLFTLVAAGLCLVFAVGVIGGASARTFRDRLARAQDVVSGRDAYLWLAQNTDRDARILVNGYTDGIVAALAERPGVVDGRAPYGEDPAWLAQAIRDVRLARSFFAVPDEDILRDLEVDYVVVGTDRALNMAVPFATDDEAVEGLDSLEHVESFGPVRIYRVVG